LRLLANGDLEPVTSFDAECQATREILTRVGDKWSVLVIVNLGEGKKRFTELKRRLSGISHRVLTATLRALERDGLLERTAHATNPPQVEYALSPLGESLLPPVTALAKWAQSHRAEVMQARSQYDSLAAAAHQRQT